MNTKILKLLTLTTGLTLNAEAINFVNFDVFSIYNFADFRVQTGTAPFPIIFHYNNGRESSTWDEIRINAKQPEGIPQRIRNFIQQNHLQNVQYFEAYCKSTSSNCNYFTHTWSMDKMIANRVTKVSTGIFEVHNLAPINGQVGVNTLVAQNMYYHDSIYLSDNVARFQIINRNQLADAWFISVYNPQANDGNIAGNRQPKTIVVHWYFFNKNMSITPQTYPTLAEAIKEWDRANTVTMKPQMTPVR